LSPPIVVLLPGVPPPPFPFPLPPPFPFPLPLPPGVVGGVVDGVVGGVDTGVPHPGVLVTAGVPVEAGVVLVAPGVPVEAGVVLVAPGVPGASVHRAGGIENGSRPPTTWTVGVVDGVGVPDGVADGVGNGEVTTGGPLATGGASPPPPFSSVKPRNRISTPATAPRMMTARRSRSERGIYAGAPALMSVV
jgi:hypothetical protein